MKKLPLILFATAFALSLFTPSIHTTNAQQYVTPNYISVSGSVDVKVVPDEVILTLGVETWNQALSEAKSANDTSVAKILSLAKTYNIDSQYVQTDYINVQPTYNNDNHVQKEITGYFVRKTIVFTLKDPSKFENLMTDALEAGANNVYGVDFRTTDLRKYRDQARAAAIQAAKEKATAMATGLDRKLGKASSITEDQPSSYTPYYNYYNGYYNNFQQQSQNSVQNAGGGSASTSDLSDDSTFAPGEIVVNAKVSVTFELGD